MDKSPDAFRSIGEVSRLVGVAPHVLRYWETQFSQLSPVKRGDGRRYYRPDDVRLVAGLCQVMREEGMSIRGAKRLISADRGVGLRRIGAGRLGEGLTVAAPGGATDMPPVPATESVVKASVTQPILMETDLPPTAALLARICAAAERLRGLESDGASLGAEAAALRKLLRTAI